MESTRPIRALVRGLDALTTLNQRNGATVSEIAQQTRLPRTTTYRILETLTHAGYVYRDPADDRYRLTIMVHRLADGFDDFMASQDMRDESWRRRLAMDDVARRRNQVRLRELVRDHGGEVRVFSAHDPVELEAFQRTAPRANGVRADQPSMNVTTPVSRS